jgi:hypothetical protein
MRPGDGDAKADVEMMPLIGARKILGRDEFLARGQQEGALVRLVPHVLMRDELQETIEALAEEARVLAAVLLHPGDEGFAVVHRRGGAGGEGRGDVGGRNARYEPAGHKARRAQ